MSPRLANIALVSAAFLLAVGLWVSPKFFLLPKRLVIDENCSIASAAATVVEVIHGRAFWSSQLGLLDKKIRKLELTPAGIEQSRRSLAMMDEEFNKAMEQVYAKNPEARPSTAQQEAARLRERADAIERAEIDEMVIAESRKVLPALRACRATLAKRAEP